MDIEIKLTNKEQEILTEAKHIIAKLDDIVCETDGIVTIDKLSWSNIGIIAETSGRVNDMIHITDEED